MVTAQVVLPLGVALALGAALALEVAAELQAEVALQVEEALQAQRAHRTSMRGRIQRPPYVSRESCRIFRRDYLERSGSSVEHG